MKDLLRNMGCGNDAIIDWMANLLGNAGLKTHSDLLSMIPSKEVLVKKRIASSISWFGFKLPEGLLDALRIEALQQRLAFSGFQAAMVSIPILFTAPRSIHLHREGQKPHKPETFTSRLAKQFAKEQQLACLVWAASEEERIKKLYESTGDADPLNSDPHFTDCQEFLINPWTQKIRQIRGILGATRQCLHVDLHGCKDPGPDRGSHLVVGLHAMELAECEDVEEFRANLRKMLEVALQGWSVNVNPLRSLAGARKDDKCTLTQQSLHRNGGSWTHSVQLEMSKSLRQRLVKSENMRAAMVKAIVNAWTLTGVEQRQPEFYWRDVLPEARKWFEECKSSRQSNQIIEQFEPNNKDFEDASIASRGTGNSESAVSFDIPIESIEKEILAKFTKMTMLSLAANMKAPWASEAPPLAQQTAASRVWFKSVEKTLGSSIDCLNISSRAFS